MVNFTTLTPAFRAAQNQAQKLVCKLGPNVTEVCGTIGIKDISKLKFNDMFNAVKGVDNVVVKDLPNGHKMIKLSGCCHLQDVDPAMNVVMTFNKQGDCLMLSGAGKQANRIEGFSLRTQEGIDELIDANVKNPGQRVKTVITEPYVWRGHKTEGGRWHHENSGTPSQDIVTQAYEWPKLS